eukprot:7262959-Pyramimonas_sp.AAC.1
MSQPKRPKLSQMGKSAFVTASGMARLMDQIKTEGLPDAFSPRSFARDRVRAASQQTSFGPLVQK